MPRKLYNNTEVSGLYNVPIGIIILFIAINASLSVCALKKVHATVINIKVMQILKVCNQTFSFFNPKAIRVRSFIGFIQLPIT